ncbi:MAG: hypothetical protein QOD41_3337, partial [Cryptosporangiaceae bacterium]|nr:hypothetical protein [Cryptosporangiaceae bacterium]
ALPGPLTSLREVDPLALALVPAAAADMCRLANTLIIQPRDAQRFGVPGAETAKIEIRRADALAGAVLSLNPAPIHVPRQPHERVIGTCRDFSVLTCALLRHRGIPARARCGFATYFKPGLGVDHWITEYWHDDERWVRADSEIMGHSVLATPEDVSPEQFLTGGEAWAAYRRGDLDASQFGVYSTDNWGEAEIRGNAVRDLAALNKVEMLPWDNWGRMEASYKGATGADYDELIDVVAATSASGDPSAVAGLYATADLQVPGELIH